MPGADGWAPLPRQALKFGLVGLVNTAAGYGVIAALQLLAHVNIFAANACGYAVGICLSFLLNRRLVFRSTADPKASGLRFAAATAAAFALNQAVLFVASYPLGKAGAGALAAQLVAMSSYTAAMFLMCRWWVFRPGEVGKRLD